MAGPSVAERERSLELINDEFDKRINQQAAAGAAIDSKATLVVGFTVVAIQISLGLDRAEPWSALAFAAFAIAFVFGLAAIALRKYRTVPRPAAVVAYYQTSAGVNGPENLREHLLSKLVGTKVDAIRWNGERDRWKVKAWWVAVVAFGLAVVLSAVSVLEAPNAKQQQRGRGQRTPSSTPSSTAATG